MSRTTPAYLQRPADLSSGEMRLFYMGVNATRTSWRRDPQSGLYLAGVLLEPERENEIVYSRDNSNAIWSPANLTKTSTQLTAPDGAVTTTVAYSEDAVSGTHQVTHNTTSLRYGAGETVSVQQWLHPMERTCVLVRLYCNQAPFFYNAYLHLVGAGSVGTTQNIDKASIERFNSDWWRCEVRMTTPSAGFVRPVYFGATGSVGSESASYPGTGNDCFAVDMVQQEVGLFSSSYIETAASAATRTADSALVYALGAEMARRQWTLLVPVMIPEHTPASDLKLLSVYKDGAAGTDHVTAWVDTSGQLKVTSDCSGSAAGSLTVSTTIADGALHWVSIHARHGRLHAEVDSQHSAADRSAGIAPDLDRLSYEPSGAWVGGVELQTRYVRKQPRPRQPQVLSA